MQRIKDLEKYCSDTDKVSFNELLMSLINEGPITYGWQHLTPSGGNKPQNGDKNTVVFCFDWLKCCLSDIRWSKDTLIKYHFSPVSLDLLPCSSSFCFRLLSSVISRSNVAFQARKFSMVTTVPWNATCTEHSCCVSVPSPGLTYYYGAYFTHLLCFLCFFFFLPFLFLYPVFHHINHFIELFLNSCHQGENHHHSKVFFYLQGSDQTNMFRQTTNKLHLVQVVLRHFHHSNKSFRL